MSKIVYNACYGGFSLSKDALLMYHNRKGTTLDEPDRGRFISRTDPDLINVVETLGKDANGPCADLKITTLPAGTKYIIEEYDGQEAVTIPEDIDWKTA
jgi:hypothetical protein